MNAHEMVDPHWDTDPATETISLAPEGARIWQNNTLFKMKGIYADYVNELAAEGKFNVEWRSVSISSLNQFPESAWTACVNDVAKGILDLCASDFWITSERLSLGEQVSFLPPLLTDKFYVMASVDSGNDNNAGIFEGITKPFTSTVWMCICAVIGLVGTFYSVFDLKAAVSDLRQLTADVDDADENHGLADIGDALTEQGE